MARAASSLPGIGKSTSWGSQLVSMIATTGMPSLRASLTAIASLLVSITNIRSGRPPMLRMPPSTRCSLACSRCSPRSSFFVRPVSPPACNMSSRSRRRLIEFDTVAQLVSVPPSQRSFMKYCAQRPAASAIASAAWRLVPTNSTRPPLAAVSRTFTSAWCNSGTDWERSMIWMPDRSPKMNPCILGFQR